MILKEKIFSSNIKLISKDSKFFPKKILDLPDCPELLFVLGNEKILNDISVSIVGTRSSSKLGNEIAFNLSSKLASNDIVIVSGLAKGIDSQAHLGTFNNGKTIGIIACGFNYYLKTKDLSIFNQIIENDGVIISEYFPDTPPQSFTFLRRNRLIAALSDITIVVEAPSHSGSLNTAQTAFKHNRSVFAIPWSINISGGEGCNFLIKNGATLLTNCEQILISLSELKTTISYSNKVNASLCSIPILQNSSNIKSSTIFKIPIEYKELYNYIKKNEPVSRIALDTSPFIENISDLNSKLTLMELQGLISFKR